MTAPDLIAGYVGQSELKTQEVIEKAKFGVLFVDETYRLFDNESGYGKKVLETIMDGMTFPENNPEGKPVIFFAGYPAREADEEGDEIVDLEKGLYAVNIGFQRRLGNTYKFPNYSCAELALLFCECCAKEEVEVGGDVEYITSLFEGHTTAQWRR